MSSTDRPLPRSNSSRALVQNAASSQRPRSNVSETFDWTHSWRIVRARSPVLSLSSGYKDELPNWRSQQLGAATIANKLRPCRRFYFCRCDDNVPVSKRTSVARRSADESGSFSAVDAIPFLLSAIHITRRDCGSRRSRWKLLLRWPC